MNEATGGNGRALWKIGEAARRAGLSTDTLRYYERLGLVEPVARTEAGYRLYRREVLERLAFVRKAQALGLTLEEIGDVLAAAASGSAPCDHVRATLRARLAEVDQRIGELQSFRRELEAALETAPAGVAPGGCVCGIIESAPDAGTSPPATPEGT